MVVVARSAEAAKWHSCPQPPVPLYPSVQGATTAPFIHPGHLLTIVLNEDQTNGFSLEPDGNQVSITFHSLFGASVDLPQRTACATTSSVLSFEFPDSGLAGPVDVTVVADGQQVAHISWTDLVGLPAATDVTPIVLGQDPNPVVLAAMGADGNLWVPAQFHGDPPAMGMPGCDGDFIIPVPLQVGAAEIVGAPPSPSNPLAQIGPLAAYLGEMVINNYDFYGMLLPPLHLAHVKGTLGVSLCRLNDAVDVVLRVHGPNSWVHSPQSPFASVAQDSRPIPLRLVTAKLIPGNDNSAEGTDDAGGPVDSLGNSCSPQPVGASQH